MRLSAQPVYRRSSRDGVLTLIMTPAAQKMLRDESSASGQEGRVPARVHYASKATYESAMCQEMARVIGMAQRAFVCVCVSRRGLDRPGSSTDIIMGVLTTKEV